MLFKMRKERNMHIFLLFREADDKRCNVKVRKASDVCSSLLQILLALSRDVTRHKSRDDGGRSAGGGPTCTTEDVKQLLCVMYEYKFKNLTSNLKFCKINSVVATLNQIVLKVSTIPTRILYNIPYVVIIISNKQCRNTNK